MNTKPTKAQLGSRGHSVETAYWRSKRNENFHCECKKPKANSLEAGICNDYILRLWSSECCSQSIGLTKFEAEQIYAALGKALNK